MIKIFNRSNSRLSKASPNNRVSIYPAISNRVSIIGGGLGGISAAIYLASAGYKVTIFEKEEHLGGKMRLVTENGYSFGTGPSLLTMPTVLEEIFAVANKTLAKHLSLTKLEPICRYSFANGETIETSHNLTKLQSEIAKISRSDAEKLPSFLEYSAKIFKRAAPTFMYRSIHDPKSFLDWEGLRHLPFLYQLDPFRTVNQAISSYFSSPQIQQLFCRYATYSGSDPYKAPATLNIIPHVEYSLGSFYVQGGMYEMAKCLTELALELGVSIVNKAEVTEIKYDQDAVTGVVVNGDYHPSNIVVSNADVVWTFTKLLDGFADKKNVVLSQEPSCSGLVFLWGVAKQHPELAHHNIFFSSNYLEEFKAIFEEQTIPIEPTIYVSISAKNDPSHAPIGHENWFVLINMPYLSDKFSWSPEKIAATRSTVLKILNCHGVSDIENLLTFEQTITPADLFRLTYSNRGSIYGISSNSQHAAFQRQANRSRELRGLYFAGGSVHPGGGIPLVLLSGRHAASLVARYHPIIKN